MYIVDFKRLYVLFDKKIRFLYDTILQYKPSIKIKYVLLVKDIYPIGKIYIYVNILHNFYVSNVT